MLHYQNMTPEDITIQTYQENFDIYQEKTAKIMSGDFVMLMDTFIQLLPKGGNILELGSAHGRDAAYLRDKGLTVTCTDVIKEALASLQDKGFTCRYYDVRDEPQASWVASFEGIIAKAVYLHTTQEVFEKSISTLSACLKEGGIFCITFKLGTGEEIETEKLGAKRYFRYYQEKELQDIVARHPEFQLVGTSITHDNKWIQLLLRKRS